MSVLNRRGRTLVAVAAATSLIWGSLSLTSQASAQLAGPSATCPAPVLTGFKVPALTYVGAKLAVTVSLSCPAASPVQVALTSNNSNLPVPATVTVGSGHQSATADLTATATEDEGQYQATLTAQYGTKSLPRTITVNPGLASAALPPCSDEPNCVFPDVLFTGPAPSGGLTVQFSSNNPVVTVPASSTFQAGSLGGDINGTVGTVTAKTRVTISATLGGVTLRASKVLLPPFQAGDHIHLSFESGVGSHIYGQEFNLEYQALLSNPASDSGVTVTFSSPSPSIELQSTSDYIPGSFTNAYTDVNTAAVTQPVHTTIVASADGVTTSLPVVIEPGLDSFTGVPALLKGGRSFTAKVNLAGPVNTRTAVALEPTAGVMSTPIVVYVAPGHSSVSFKVTTVPVTSRTQVNILGTLGTTEIGSSTVTLIP